jgi:hypothetical protein
MLALYSLATHCIEWQAPPQKSLVPVAATMTCVPITAPAPTIRPMTRSDSTDQRALGDVRRRHQPGRVAVGTESFAMPPPADFVALV